VNYDKEVRLVIEEYIRILTEFVEENKGISREVINEIEEFLYDKAVSFEKAQVYELIGDAVQDNEYRNKCDAFTNYSKALELYIVGKHEDALGQIIIKIAKERVDSKEYEEAIKYILLLTEERLYDKANELVEEWFECRGC